MIAVSTSKHSEYYSNIYINSIIFKMKMKALSIRSEWSQISFQECSFYLENGKKSLKSPAHGCLEENCIVPGG